MPNKLFIRVLSLSEDEDKQLTNFEWALYARAGQKLAGGIAAQFDEVQKILEQNAIEDVQIIGLVPANNINSTQVTIPGKQTRFVQQALPFAVEEQLTEDLNSVHLALGAKNPDGSYSVEVINRGLFECFYDALVETGYTINGIFSDASLLPIKDIDIAIGFEDNWALVNFEPHTVSRVKLFNLANYFESSLVKDDDVETENSRKVSCYIPPQQLESLKIILAELQQNDGVEFTSHDLNIPLIELLCESWFQLGTQGINLCQGEFKVASTNAPSLKKWTAVAVVAGIWFLLQVGLDIGKGYYYQAEANKYEQQALQVYKNIFPAERRVTVNNLRRTLKGKLNIAGSSAGGHDFLSLLSETGYQYSQIPNNDAIKFNSVNFSDQRKELTIELSAASFQQLDELKNALTSSGLGAKISSAINEKDSVRGRLSVTGS
jgi:general secretion pathway protein L